MSLIEKFDSARILCVGDVMLDRFVSGQVRRISPESPVPVLSATATKSVAGGAANVARNVSALGGHCTIVGVLGEDPAGDDLIKDLARDERIAHRFVVDPRRPTTEKTRFVTNGQHMLRVDSEVTYDISAEVEQRLLCIIGELMDSHDVLVISDYAKGLLTEKVLKFAIDCAKSKRLPVVVDPKAKDFRRYSGATLVTPNAAEAKMATEIDPTTNDNAVHAGNLILSTCDIEFVLMTRAEKGMTLVGRGIEPVHIPAAAREVADVVGAGDTVIATLALVMACGGKPDIAATIANTAAGIVVGKRGTATTTRSELLEAIAGERSDRGAMSVVKVLTWEEAGDLAKSWEEDGLRVGFTNGCFDILHLGHTSILNFARSNCDRLIVGINSDDSVRRLKGPSRPVNTETDRAGLLAALAVVDGVVVFDQDTPRELIEFLKPNVLVKGADYKIEEIVGADTVLARGGEVLRFELLPGKSTTGIIARANSGQAGA